MNGVYLVKNDKAGKVYVGSSADVDKRLIYHKSQLKTRHPAMISSLKNVEFNFEDFSFQKLCELETRELAYELEEFLLQEIPEDRLYNLAFDRSGGKVKFRNRERYRAGAAKRNSDPEYRVKLSAACRGKRKIVTCPKCGISGGGGNMRRYHFDRCKK
jgi:group I intron endonuclease